MEPVLVIIGVLVVLGLVSYFFLMIYFPEWVGITGPQTKKELEEEAQALEAKQKSESFTQDNREKNS